MFLAEIRRMEINKSSYEKKRENEVRFNISKMLETIPEGVNLDQFMEYYKVRKSSLLIWPPPVFFCFFFLIGYIPEPRMFLVHRN